MLMNYRMGDEIKHCVILRVQKTGASSNGGVFARGSLQDNSGTLNFICFERETVDFLKSLPSVSAIRIHGVLQADRYAADGALQVVISKAEHPAKEDSLEHLLPYSPKDLNQYKQYLEELIEGIAKPHLKSLLRKVLSGALYEKYVVHSAAMRLHHAYVGGLLEHSVDVAKLAKVIALEIGNIDVDLVVAGCLLHDIGKLHEISPALGFEYTEKGKLLGHLSLGTMMLNRFISQEKDFPQEDALCLLHILLSHHGSQDKGSPVACATKESFVVHYADELNAIMTQFEASDDRSNWQYSKMLNRYLRVTS